jgi:phosphoserine phosphatase
LRLTLFDLDHTLLDGDSDQLWCEFLMDRGMLPREPFESLNRDMARGHADGSNSAQAFCNFYIGTPAGRSADDRRRGPLHRPQPGRAEHA